MQDEEEHVALPRLVGAPAYGRPPIQIMRTAVAPDPDDLPLAAEQTPEERAIAERLMATPLGLADRPRVPLAERPMPAIPERQPRFQPPVLTVLAERILGRTS